MLSTIAMYAAIVGSAALAVVGTIFVVTMRRNVGGAKIGGWKKKVLHPAPYLRFAGLSYLVAAITFGVSKLL